MLQRHEAFGGEHDEPHDPSRKTAPVQASTDERRGQASKDADSGFR